MSILNEKGIEILYFLQYSLLHVAKVKVKITLNEVIFKSSIRTFITVDLIQNKLIDIMFRFWPYLSINKGLSATITYQYLFSLRY